MGTLDLFSYQDYKKYLQDLVERQPRGFKKAMAEASRVQTAYVSHMLHGKAHLSWEQAEALSRFIGHSKDETQYFLHLVEYTRAGTLSLRSLLSEQLEQIREKSLSLKSRVKVKESLSREDQSTYYSAWHYSAIHMMLTIPQFQTRESLVKHLHTPQRKVSEVLDFLISVGLAVFKNGKYEPGATQIHLERNSPLISKHHTNWRMKAIQNLDQAEAEDLHFSSVVTLSSEDLQRIRSILTKTIEQSVEIIKASPEEKLVAIGIDFYEIK